MVRKRAKASKMSSIKKNGSKGHISQNKPLERASRHGDERKVHDEIISRRVSGGIHVTRQEVAEAYIRAKEQWLRLPGSIIKTPIDAVLIQKSLESKDTLETRQTTNDN